MYKKFSDFTIFDPPDVSDYIVGYRELGGEFRTTLGSVTEIVRRYSSTLLTNTVFVNLSGSDIELGTAEQVGYRTIKRGLAKALELSRNLSPIAQQYEEQYGWGTFPNPVTVFVRGGDYIEDNPIYVPPGVSVVGENSRSVNFIPKNKFYDGFWVNNKTSIQGLNFKDFLEPAYGVAFPEFEYLNGVKTSDYLSERINLATSKAYSNYSINPEKYTVTKLSRVNFINFSNDVGSPIFNPFKIAFLSRYFKDIVGNELFYNEVEYLNQADFWDTDYYKNNIEKPYIINPPYIKDLYFRSGDIPFDNNTVGGSVYVDGNNVSGPIRTLTVDGCTHFNQGGRGIHVTNNGHAFVSNDSSVCCSEAVLVDDGGNCNINVANYSFGLSGLVALGKSSKPTMLGVLKNTIFTTDTNKITVTNLGSPLLSALQVFPEDKNPYVGQLFQIIDRTYTEITTSGINFLSAQNSGTYFVIQSASDLRPASFPYQGYECDIIIEGNYSLQNDTSIIGKTFIPPVVDKLYAGAEVLFYIQSKIVSSSQNFYHIGTGTDYLNSVPQNGVQAKTENEINQDLVGRILCDSSNHNGDKKLGSYITFNQLTGEIGSNSLTTNVLNAVSANIDILDVKKYEVSGFEVKGDLNIGGVLNVDGTSSFGDDTEISGDVKITGVTDIEANSTSPALRISQIGTGSSLLVEDSSRNDSTPFIVTNDGSVGIGTSNPLEKLTIVGNLSSTGKHYIGDRLFLDRDENNHAWIGSQGTIQEASRQALGFESDLDGTIKHLDFYTNSVSRLHVTYEGNVGIGTDHPNVDLTVAGSISAYNFYGDGSGLTSITAKAYGDYLPLSGGNIEGVVSLSAFSYDAVLQITQSGPGHVLYVEDSERVDNTPFVITHDGKIGMGTPAPMTSIHIDKTDALVLPVGNTSQRVDVKGGLRYNSQLSAFEGFDGERWGQLGGVVTSDVTSDLEVGAIQPAQVITTNTTFQEFVELLLTKTFYPTFVNPSANMSGSLSTNVESGTTGITLNISLNRGSIVGNTVGGIWNPSVSQNFRSGSANNYTFLGNNNGTNSSYSSPSTVIGDNSNVFNGTVSYDQGPQPLDSKGNDYLTPLNAGTINVSFTVYGRRKAFYGVNNNASSSSNIRALSNSLLNPSNGTSFTINIPSGATNVVFAYPSTLRDVNSVKYVEGLNAEVKGIFTQTTVSVEGLNGYTGVNYKVYKYTPASPFSSSATYNVTI